MNNEFFITSFVFRHSIYEIRYSLDDFDMKIKFNFRRKIMRRLMEGKK